MKHLVLMSLLALALVGCGKDGATGLQGPAGAKGDKGEQGDVGPAGADAELPPYAVTTIVDPCGDAPGVVDEVLLKLANGQVLASFSDNSSGANTRFALLSPGTYVTTDGSSCVFTLHSDGSITY